MGALQVISCLLLLVALTHVANSYKPCIVNDFPAEPDFNLYKFVGKWYVLKYIPLNPPSYGDRFTDYTLTFTSDYSKIVDVHGLRREREKKGYHDHGTCVEHNGKLKKTLEKGKFDYEREEDGTEVEGDFWVIDTDHTSFAVVYGCRQQTEGGECQPGKVEIWVLGRTPDEHPDIDDALSQVCVEPEDLIKIEHKKECEAASGATITKASWISLAIVAGWLTKAYFK